MNDKVLVTEETQQKLQDANVQLDKEDAQLIESVNKSGIAVARYEESVNKVVIKESLCG